MLRQARNSKAAAEATQRHAILLTDGKNESEHASVLDRAVEAAQGVFQCDCRGVGADWDVNEVFGAVGLDVCDLRHDQ